VSERAPHVLVTNCVVLNAGDAAILVGVLDSMRAALGEDTTFEIAESQPEVARRHYPELAIRPMLHATFGPVPRIRGAGRAAWWARRWRVRLAAWCLGRGAGAVARAWMSAAQLASLRAIGRADVVVSTGGTYLVERYPLWGRIVELEAALAMGKPLVLFTQSLGPFADRRHRRALRSIARRARLVLLRDERSRAHLADIGAAGDHIHVVADAAFGLTAPLRPAAPAGLRVAVSVRDWPYAAGDGARANRVYREAIAALVERLVRERDAQVTFVSTCQGVAEYWTDDSAVAAEVAALLAPDVRDRVEVDRAFHTPADLLELLARHDVVVATRMHMAILSLVAGTPAFPIAYEFKTRELAARLGLGGFVSDLEEVDAAELPAAVERFLDMPGDFFDALRAAVAAERASAAATAPLLAQALGGTAARRA
jgi:colanic acid/amylovoran biosynthesis protein